MINDKTTRSYPLPHPENIAKHDVVRIREAFVAVDADITDIKSECFRIIAEQNKNKFEEFLGLWRNGNEYN
jgi:hypothetical protein